LIDHSLEDVEKAVQAVVMIRLRLRRRRLAQYTLSIALVLR
jgi:hypothetical protein